MSYSDRKPSLEHLVARQLIDQGHLNLQLLLLCQLNPQSFLERLSSLFYPGVLVRDWSHFQQLYGLKNYYIRQTDQGIYGYSLRLLARLNDRAWLGKMYRPGADAQNDYVLEGAVEGGHLDLVRALAARTHLPLAYTQIEKGVLQDRLDLTQFLLELPFEENPQGPTRGQILSQSLTLAVGRGSVDMATLLLHHEAEVSQSTLEVLLHNRDLPMLELLLDKSGVSYGQLLVMTAGAGQLDMVRTIIRKANSHIYLLPDYSQAAMVAHQGRHPEVVEFLLSNLEHPPVGEFDQIILESRTRVAQQIRRRLNLI